MFSICKSIRFIQQGNFESGASTSNPSNTDDTTYLETGPEIKRFKSTDASPGPKEGEPSSGASLKDDGSSQKQVSQPCIKFDSLSATLVPQNCGSRLELSNLQIFEQYHKYIATVSVGFFEDEITLTKSFIELHTKIFSEGQKRIN